MKVPAFKPLFALPPLFWLGLAVASFIAAFSVWQNQRLERLRPPAVAAPAPAAGTPNADAATEATPMPATAQGSNPSAPGAAAVGGASAPRPPEPQAGRQVLRCVSKGRVTYRDLNAGCPDGAAERVTVFPTEGVGKPQ